MRDKLLSRSAKISLHALYFCVFSNLVACGSGDSKVAQNSGQEKHGQGSSQESKSRSQSVAALGEAKAGERQLYRNKPLVEHMYTADPSAHVFNGRLYIYPSHDIETDAELGGAEQFAMRDYHVFSLSEVGGEVTDHGKALDVDDVPWASQQMWAPDAAERDGQYYLYFPAKDKQGIFRVGVAKADNPGGPFKAEPAPIEGAISIDPSVYNDNGEYYLYVGGIWGGQLQRWQSGEYVSEDNYPADDQPALMPKVAKLNADMVSLAEPLRDVLILDAEGKPIQQGDNARRFFEAAWVHKYEGVYYFSYSTGDTHYIRYATGASPYGPFTYQGTVLAPVHGWTNHHSIAEFNGRWYVFYHDSQLSGGQTHLRSIKMVEVQHNKDGSITPVDVYFGDKISE